MNIEEKLLQAKAEIAFQKIYNDFKKPFSESLNETCLFFQDEQLKIKMENICNDFKKSFSQNLDEIFSIFEDKKFIKRIQKNQIYMFKDTGMLIDPIRSDKTSYRIFEHGFYRITYQENELVIEYFVLNREILKDEELAENIDEELAENIEKWNIKDFNFCDNLENFHIKYEIRLGKENSFKIIKKQENLNTDIFLEGTFGKLFVKVLEFSDLSSGFAKDIIKFYYENKIFNVDFEFADEIDEKDFKKFKSLPDFLSFKYNVPSTRKLRKLPLSIMEEFFKDEFLRFDENNYILNFIFRNKQVFLTERMNVGAFENPKGIIETYFDASGIYDKFYESKIKEYDILEEKQREENKKTKKEDKPILIYFPKRRKGTDKYVKEILRDTFNLGKNLNIRNIVKRIERCSTFQNLENLHNKLIKKINEQEIENISEYKINIPKRLYLEGLKQSNCVYSYLPMIENGECIILSYEENEYIFTIEVIINKNKFRVAQCLGRFNTITDKSEEIKNKINSLNNLYSF